MTDQDNLRDMIAEVISSATTGWVRDEYVTDLSEGDYIAQAIIDEFELTVEECPCAFDCKGTRLAGKWED